MIKSGKYEAYISPYTLDEMVKERDREKRYKMAALIAEYGVKVLDETDEVNRYERLVSGVSVSLILLECENCILSQRKHTP